MKQIMAVVLIVIAFGIVFFIFRNDNPDLLGGVHEHADFKVYLNGNEYSFEQEKYISNKNKTLSNFIHLHDIKGDVMHKHSKGINLGFFFETLDMKFNSTCFLLDNETEFCNNGGNIIKMYVNGVRNNKYDKYEFKDLDRIVISYGNEEENVINQQIDSVTDKACIQSGKCPERGEPSDESSCLTQEGCAVENA